MKIPTLLSLCGLASLLLSLTACKTHYVTPGGPARLEAISHPKIADAFSAKPEANFPASIVLVRIQSPQYRSWGISGHSVGDFSVITLRDFENGSHFERIQSQPDIAGAITLNKLLLTDSQKGELALREAAAKLHADMLLIYTMDTQFFDRNKSTPLTVFTLGATPTKDLLISSVASALIVDVRTGFVYGALEGADKATRSASVWTTRDAVEATRKETEAAAFNQLIDEFAPFWKTVVVRYKSKEQPH
jgi:hypothetical protein